MTLLCKHELEYMKSNRTSKLFGEKIKRPVDIGYESESEASSVSAAEIGVLLQSDETRVDYLIEPKSKLIDNSELYFHHWPNP